MLFLAGLLIGVFIGYIGLALFAASAREAECADCQAHTIKLLQPILRSKEFIA
jgi:uncharacterized membrane-anchored protein YhcB (DUF1043 family)